MNSGADHKRLRREFDAGVATMKNEAKPRVYDILAKAFAQEDVRTCFALLGDANMNWAARLSEEGCRMVYVRIPDRKSTRLNSSHLGISYAVFCLKKKIASRKFHETTLHFLPLTIVVAEYSGLLVRSLPSACTPPVCGACGCRSVDAFSSCCGSY